MPAHKVYLAGPEVFRPDAKAEGARLKALCEAAGIEGLYPFDAGDADIRRGCIGLIHRADAMVANISPFRGHHMDPGTAFEIGYAQALGKPVYLWSADPRALAARIPAHEEPGRDVDGHLIEDFGKAENLMIVPDGAHVWASAEEAIAEAGRRVSHGALNRQLQRETRRSVVIAFGIAIAVAFGASFVVNYLVGW
ncbi:nucleoside 2-deoxyribosyltransferase [Ancylobacter sp. A5.8]|uniref:nucleoside 2-deoxyribosyltransferase n=1 Tax=Ancylobacter gelatini TaxID=2919920 RepID=UPI001F4E2263|nr:nucleoside 2-deoxyribosyltransferase [Ancylobacter gelatini]MCJ8141565.1 nucleoside 2-deoxyribosyltransferase [Ancylobacter gelatini]